MEVPHYFVLFLSFIHICIITVTGKCPDKLPLEIDGRCYRLQTDIAQYSQAVDNCRNLAENSHIISYMYETPDKIAKEIKDFIVSKLEKAYFWIGFKMDDTAMKDLEDREWSFDFDDTKVVQKKYEVWADHPTESALTCAVMNGSRDFDVVAVDCGGPRLPVVCMKKNDPCKDDQKPYLKYGDNCLFVLSGALEYNKIAGACSPDTPTPVKDKKMKKYIVNAILNSFLGGAAFVGVTKMEGFYFFGSRLVPNNLWAEGEPNQDHDCAGLSLQMDGTVKLRTLSCNAYASSLCHIKGE
ncbi:c-type lectin domain-containing protein [Caerostris darwini]|uniref:C-type lectin domain-containing protein n=1 Tax=Caerostris darwini TaxID=1538125 RepID=A0AAV4VTA7_9ARAC|nr:c-type lectin domain-containing protein [Caerostris darwini]